LSCGNSKFQNFIENGADAKYFGRKSIMIKNEGYVNLAKGEYFLTFKVHFTEKKPSNYVVSSYSAKKITFEMMEYQVGKGLFFETLKKMGRNFQNPVKFQSENCEMKFDLIDHFGVIYLKNSIKLMMKKISKLGRKEEQLMEKNFRLK